MRGAHSPNEEECGSPSHYEKALRIGYLMPVRNPYFCMDVKLGLSQRKFSVKYKPL